jgi:hypothetical protein
VLVRATIHRIYGSEIVAGIGVEIHPPFAMVLRIPLLILVGQFAELFPKMDPDNRFGVIHRPLNDESQKKVPPPVGYRSSAVREATVSGAIIPLLRPPEG